MLVAIAGMIKMTLKLQHCIELTLAAYRVFLQNANARIEDLAAITYDNFTSCI